MFIVMITSHSKSTDDMNTKIGILSTGRRLDKSSSSVWSYEVHVDITDARLNSYITELQKVFFGKEDVFKSFHDDGDKLNLLWLPSKSQQNNSYLINRNITSFLHNFYFNLQITGPNYKYFP